MMRFSRILFPLLALLLVAVLVIVASPARLWKKWFPEPLTPVDRLTLVSAAHPWPGGAPQGLVNIADRLDGAPLVLKNTEMQAQEEAVEALAALARAAEDAGVGRLRLVSAYRSVDYQAGLFRNKVARVLEAGTPADQAEEIAAREVARPGTSEHHTGYAFDFAGPDGTLDSFYGIPAYQWVAAHGAEYGFIIRYPESKSDVTGIIYEPWHLRYVGADAAREMAAGRLCLEEYLARP